MQKQSSRKAFKRLLLKLTLAVKSCSYKFSVYRIIFHQEIGLNSCIWGCLSDIASLYFSRESKIRTMSHQGSVGVSSEQNKRNLTLTRNLLLSSIVFLNKICVFIIIFRALSFLRLIHGLSFVEVMSVRLNDFI